MSAEKVSIIELNDAITILDDYIKGFGNRETWNSSIGELKKSEIMEMRKNIEELRLHRIDYLSNLVKEI